MFIVVAVVWIVVCVVVVVVAVVWIVVCVVVVVHAVVVEARIIVVEKVKQLFVIVAVAPKVYLSEGLLLLLLLHS